MNWVKPQPSAVETYKRSQRVAPWPLAPFPGPEKEVKKAAVNLGCSAGSYSVERDIVHTMCFQPRGGNDLFVVSKHLVF